MIGTLLRRLPFPTACLLLCLFTSTPALAADAAFNDSTGLLSLPVVNVPGTGVVNATLSLSGTNPIQFTLNSAEVYASPPTLDEFSAQVQNGSTLYLPRVQVGSDYYELNMALINDNPIIFGNLQVLSVTPVPTAPDPLESSISRGQTLYAQLCTSCHGSTGRGTSQAPSLVGSASANFSTLRTKIHNSMPSGNASACVDSGSSTCATDISNYIINRLR